MPSIDGFILVFVSFRLKFGVCVVLAVRASFVLICVLVSYCFDWPCCPVDTVT